MRSKPKNEVSPKAITGEKVQIWDHSKVCDGAHIGKNSIIGRSVYIGPGVFIGDNCKIQNNSQIYEPAMLESGVFIGPGVILTNDLNPRAVNSDLRIKSPNDWVKQGVTIKVGASIGAGSLCIAPVKIGKWAMVGAGSTVLRDVPDFALVVGAPAHQIGWVGKLGFKLIEIQKDIYLCERSGDKYLIIEGEMRHETD